MKDKEMTKERLIQELEKLRQKIKELETSEKKHKKVERAYWESEERYRQSVENSPNPIFSVDEKGIIQTWNQACEQVFQYGAEEIIGKKYRKLLWDSEDISAVEAMMDHVWEGSSVSNQDITFRCKDKTQRYTVSRLYPVHNHEGSVQYCVFANTDITDRKLAEERIKNSLKEKEVLLLEVHHRVKNNMQVIYSLINLQSRLIEDKRALEMFNETKNRVRSMALVHEKLYKSEDLARIDFNYYIRSLATHLFHSYSVGTSVVKLKVNVDEVFLDINTAIPCGLIINELVSNSLKHAFPDERIGEIFINLFSVKKGKYSLTVKDNGVGFPEDLDFRKCETLGIQLVIMLVEQLNGSIEFRRNHGTEFQILFKEVERVKLK